MYLFRNSGNSCKMRKKKKKEKLEKPKNFPETKKQGYWNQNEE